MTPAPSKAAIVPADAESGGGRALAGFLLSGFLLALLGAILPAWGYHRDPPDFTAVGNYFLSLAVGIVAAARLAPRIMAGRGLTFLLVSACALSCVALAYLALVSPPLSQWWRVAGLLALGIGAGLLDMGLFYAISRSYQADAAGTVNLGGIWYGLGCLAATLLVAGTFSAYYAVPSILLFMAAVPGVFAAIYARSSYAAPPAGTQPSLRQALADFRSPGAILFALLLFFQFGNEFSIAGWLPLLLIRRVGLSPSAALLTLALYWFCLMTGRLGAVAILPRVRHGRLLVGSVLLALFGCLILFSTNNGFGAAMGAVFVGCGYAPMYPLVAEAIGRRFPYYHPGFFNGIFSFALVGGLIAPATLGYLAVSQGVGVVMGIPLIGTCTVMVLILLIWLETKVTGR
ncbi:Major facilitator superfamily MFS_1 [Candidatus Sulfopaludibacter sp. SbA4]|nr:Major facilitator superfamily MFS_1 [Candidatus Sulfopaludibacter sp. SbA4]